MAIPRGVEWLFAILGVLGLVAAFAALWRKRGTGGVLLEIGGPHDRLGLVVAQVLIGCGLATPFCDHSFLLPGIALMSAGAGVGAWGTG